MSLWISAKQSLPKSKERVIVLFVNDAGNKIITIAERINEKEVLEEDYLSEESIGTGFAEYDEENDCYWTPAGWYEWQYITETNWFLCDEGKVINWMPLPDLNTAI